MWKGLQKKWCHFFDRKFFPLGSCTSCCPLYRHENKGLNSPVISFPSVLCFFSLAGDLLCLLESLWALLPALERCLCATLAGAERHGGSCQPCNKKALELVLAGAARLQEWVQRMPARVKHPLIDFPAELYRGMWELPIDNGKSGDSLWLLWILSCFLWIVGSSFLGFL